MVQPDAKPQLTMLPQSRIPVSQRLLVPVMLHAACLVKLVSGLPTPNAELDSPAPPTLLTGTHASQPVLAVLTQSHALILMQHAIQPKPTNRVNAALVLPAVPLHQLKS